VDALKSDGPFTVFAPTDAAFAALEQAQPGVLAALLADPTGDLTQILLYHVLDGKVMAEAVTDGLVVPTLQGSEVTFSIVDGVAKINQATIIVTDIEASNGVIHVIDAVLLPPAQEAMETAEEPAPTATPAPEEEMAAESAELADIVDTAVAAGGFETLVAAVQAAGLVDALKGEGPFTVFAPTDAAFAAVEEAQPGTLEALLADPGGLLTDILLYHVIAGKVMAADVTDGLVATTLLGEDVTFSVADGIVKINDATVIVADIEASNGVIHVIDAVLLPPADEAAPAVTATPVAEEEPAATATPVAAEEPAAPETMPATGGNFGSNPLIFVVVAAVVMGLAGGVWVTRRRA
jgi:transforming growth factor-beta-induced protein